MQWRRQIVYFLASLLLLASLSANPLQADERKDVEKQLKKSLKNKVTFFQNFYEATKLEFDHNGQLRKGSNSTGPWTLYGVIEIKNVKIKNGKYEIYGNRGVLIYDEGNFESPKLMRSRINVTIILDTESPAPSYRDFFEKAKRVFYSAETPPEEITPPSYRFYITGTGKHLLELPPTTETTNDKSAPKHIYDVGGEISRPTCLSCPDPNYPLLAREARVEGTVVLWAIIDEQGHTRNVRIDKPRGAGLDEAVIKSVEMWKFRPAMRNSEPVAVGVTIEVKFNLF